MSLSFVAIPIASLAGNENKSETLNGDFNLGVSSKEYNNQNYNIMKTNNAFCSPSLVGMAQKIGTRLGRYLGLLLIPLMSLLATSAWADASTGSCGDNLEWSFDEMTGTLTITGSGEMKAYSQTNQPWASFKDRIRKVVSSARDITIGKYAFFQYTELTSVDLTGVTSVGQFAFQECSNLSSVDFSNVSIIGNGAFFDTGLTSVDLSNQTEIAENAFSFCSKLSTVILNGSAMVGNTAFAFDEALSTIVVTPGSSTWGSNVFSSSTLDKLIFTGSVPPACSSSLPEGTKVYYPDETSSPYTTTSPFSEKVSNNLLIPMSRQEKSASCTIKGYAVSGWYSNDNSILVTDSYQILNAADNINVTNSDHEWGEWTIKTEGTSCLEKGEKERTCSRCNTTETADALVSSGSCGTSELSWSFSCDNNTLTITGNGTMNSYSAGSQPWYAFKDNIEKVVFSGNDITISKKAFEAFTNLRSVELDGVSNVGQFAFQDCSNLYEVDFSNVTTIGNGAFYSSGLNKADLSNVTEIGTNAFAECMQLNYVLLNGNANLGSDVFTNDVSLNRIVVTSSHDNAAWGTDLFTGCEHLEMYFTGNFPPSCSSALPSSTSVYYQYGFDDYTTTSPFKDMNLIPMTYHMVSDATCTENGYAAEGWYIGDENGMFLSRQYKFYEARDYIISALGHSWGEWSISQPGTSCSDRGLKEHTCNRCYISETADALVTSGSCGTNLTWSYSCGISTMTISGTGAMDNYESASDQPWASFKDDINMVVFDGSDITIGNFAFANMSKLAFLENMSNVSAIGSNAFNGSTYLASADLSTATSIGEGAFKGCTGLKAVGTINATSISDATFEGCSALWDVKLPNVTSIGDKAFKGCEALKTIDLTNVTSLGNGTFENCTVLNSLGTLNVTTLGNSTFKNCNGLSSIDLSKVTTLGDSTFAGCNGLRSVDLSNVTSVGNNAFSNCLELISVVLNGNASLGNEVFSNDTWLKSVLVTPNTSATTWGTDVFKGSTLSKLVFIGDIPPTYSSTLPSSTKVYYKNGATAYATTFASLGAANLITMTHHDVTVASCTETGYSLSGWYSDEGNGIVATDDNQVLDAAEYIHAKIVPAGSCGTDLTWSYSCTDKILTIKGSGAMDNFSNANVLPWASYRNEIEKVVFDGSDITVGNHAFDQCGALTSVDFTGVTALGDFAFWECTGLTNVDLTGVTALGNYAFWECTGLTNVDSKDVETIGESTFLECKNLTSIDLSNVTTIGKMAFSSCSSLTSIDLSNVTSVGTEAFIACKKLTSVNLTNQTALSDGLFESCSSLASVDLSNVTTIGERTFANCENLTSIDLSNVTSIGSEAFDGCENLASVNLPDNMTTLSDRLFLGCTNLTTIDLENVTSIGVASFGMSGLKSIDLSNVTTVDAGAFYLCADLESVILNGNATVDYMAFSGDSKLSSVVVTPSTSSTTWGADVFKDASLDKLVFTGNVLPSYKQNDEYDSDASSLYEAMAVPATTKIYYPSTSSTVYTAAFASHTTSNLIAMTKHEKQAATCSAVGYAATGWYSSDENGILVNNAYKIYNAKDSILAIDANAHSWGDWTVKTPASCSSKGVNERVCKNNSAHTETAEFDFVNTGSCGTNLTWTYSCDDNSLTISGTGAMNDYDGNQPWSGVKANLEKVIFVGELITIGKQAFAEFKNITSVDLSDVTAIGEKAFDGCGNLTSVDLSSVKSIGDGAFENCELSDVVINGGATLASEAFSDNAIPMTVVVTESSTKGTWNDDVFQNCVVEKLVMLGSAPETFDYTFEGASVDILYYPEASDYADWSAAASRVAMTQHDKGDATCSAVGYSETGWYSNEKNGIFVNEKNEVKAAADYILPIDADAHDFSDKTLSATPNAEGLYAYVCGHDGNHLSDYTVIKGATAGDNIELTKDAMGNYSLTELNIVDGKAISYPVSFSVDKVTYNRVANRDTMTFMLPYDIPASAINGQVYVLNTFDGKTLHYSKVTDVAKANTPYLLLVGSKDALLVNDVENVTVKATATTEIATASTATQFGAYSSTDYTSDASKVYYAYQNNKFYRGDVVTVNPFRTAIFLDKGSVVGNPAPANSLNSINVVFDEEEVTGMELTDAENEVTGKVNVYDALGRAVRFNVDAASCLDGLSNGIYMVNGHKFVVRNK